MKRTFNFAKGKDFEVKDTIEQAEIPFTWEWSMGSCPHCKKKITKTNTYTIDKVEVLEASDGSKIYLGFTKEKVGDRPLTFRLPDKDFCSDKDMTAQITAKLTGKKEEK